MSMGNRRPSPSGHPSGQGSSSNNTGNNGGGPARSLVLSTAELASQANAHAMAHAAAQAGIGGSSQQQHPLALYGGMTGNPHQPTDPNALRALLSGPSLTHRLAKLGTAFNSFEGGGPGNALNLPSDTNAVGSQRTEGARKRPSNEMSDDATFLANQAAAMCRDDDASFDQSGCKDMNSAKRRLLSAPGGDALSGESLHSRRVSLKHLTTPQQFPRTSLGGNSAGDRRLSDAHVTGNPDMAPLNNAALFNSGQLSNLAAGMNQLKTDLSSGYLGSGPGGSASGTSTATDRIVANAQAAAAVAAEASRRHSLLGAGDDASYRQKLYLDALGAQPHHHNAMSSMNMNLPLINRLEREGQLAAQQNMHLAMMVAKNNLTGSNASNVSGSLDSVHSGVLQDSLNPLNAVGRNPLLSQPHGIGVGSEADLLQRIQGHPFGGERQSASDSLFGTGSGVGSAYPGVGSLPVGGGSLLAAAAEAARGEGNGGGGENRQPAQQRRVLLSMDQDAEKLSDQQCFIRKQIEAFTASDVDVTTHTRGRNKPVIMGQVGIRCIHCSKLPIPDRGPGAVYFPSSLGGVYQAAQNIQKYHLRDGCQSMPPDVLSECKEIVLCKSNLGGGKQYWTDTARALGLVDTPDGIRFREDVNYTQLFRDQARQTQGQLARDADIFLSSIPMNEDRQNEVVHPDDRSLVSDYLYFLLCQVRPCHLEDADRVGYRKEQDLGMPGLECKHCGGTNGGTGSGRFFRSTASSIAKNENMAQIYKHMKNCPECPDKVKILLDSLKQHHQAQVSHLKRGWKKIFFERVMYRLCVSRDRDAERSESGGEDKSGNGSNSGPRKREGDTSPQA